MGATSDEVNFSVFRKVVIEEMRGHLEKVDVVEIKLFPGKIGQGQSTLAIFSLRFDPGGRAEVRPSPNTVVINFNKEFS